MRRRGRRELLGARRRRPGIGTLPGNAVEDRLRFADEVGSASDLPMLAARGEDERVGDAAADDQRVDFGRERIAGS